jgi:hypothetical protein
MAANANLLMYQVRREGQEVTRLEEERARLEDDGLATAMVTAQLEQARLRANELMIEWSSEVRYINAAMEMDAETHTGNGPTMQMLTPMRAPEAEARLEERSEFSLLHEIAIAAEFNVGLEPAARNAIRDRDDLLAIILAEDRFPALLVRMNPADRLRYMNRLGAVVAAAVPEETLMLSTEELATQRPALPPAAIELCQSIVGHMRDGTPASELGQPDQAARRLTDERDSAP